MRYLFNVLIWSLKESPHQEPGWSAGWESKEEPQCARAGQDLEDARGGVAKPVKTSVFFRAFPAELQPTCACVLSLRSLTAKLRGSSPPQSFLPGLRSPCSPHLGSFLPLSPRGAGPPSLPCPPVFTRVLWARVSASRSQSPEGQELCPVPLVCPSHCDC